MFDLEEAAALLERTPALLHAWLVDLPEVWLSADEGPDTFSPREVVGHLLHGEETDWIARTRRILEHGESVTFDRYDRFAQRERYGDWPMTRLLAGFAAARAGNLRTLRAFGLTPADLDRRGMHPALGSVTLRQLLSTWVVHDQSHITQIARVMAKRYDETVGPWSRYLRVLGRREE
jgi:hypothetical protein